MNEKNISGWYSHSVTGGQDLTVEVERHLNNASIILLLVSPDFVASDDIRHGELRRAMELHYAGNSRIIPILLRPTDWKGTAFGKLAPLPDNGIPVISWDNLDSAFLNIAEGIRKILSTY